jgi:hypothetical protein
MMKCITIGPLEKTEPSGVDLRVFRFASTAPITEDRP